VSVWRLLLGLSAYLALLAALALSMSAAARLVGRVVGVREFRWFRELPSPAAWWRLWTIRLAAALAPLGVAVVLSTAAFYVNGIPRVTTRVEVQPGPAQEAGIRTNDRIVSIGGKSVTTWNALREEAQRAVGPTPVIVERNGRRIELTVIARDHRFRIAPLQEADKPALSAALARGSALRFTTIAASFKGFARIAKGRDPPEFVGPGRVVPAGGAASHEGTLLTFLAVLAAYLCPFFAGVPFFDAAVSWAFRSMHPAAVGSTLRGYRLERLRLALLLAASGYLTLVIAASLVSAGLPLATVLLLWSIPSAAATYPLIFITGNEIWSRSVTLLMLGVALFIPCVPLLVALGLLRDIYVALRNEGFRTGWFRVEPASD